MFAEVASTMRKSRFVCVEKLEVKGVMRSRLARRTVIFSIINGVRPSLKFVETDDGLGRKTGAVWCSRTAGQRRDLAYRLLRQSGRDTCLRLDERDTGRQTCRE